MKNALLLLGFPVLILLSTLAVSMVQRFFKGASRRSPTAANKRVGARA